MSSIASKQRKELSEEIEQLEFLLRSYMRNTRVVNNRYRWQIEEIETAQEVAFSISRAKKNEELMSAMIASREYQDMLKVDKLLASVPEEDIALIVDRYFYRESLEKVGSRYNYDKSATHRKIKRILEKLIRKI